MKKSPSTKQIPGAKNVGDCWFNLKSQPWSLIGYEWDHNLGTTRAKSLETQESPVSLFGHA